MWDTSVRHLWVPWVHYGAWDSKIPYKSFRTSHSVEVEVIQKKTTPAVYLSSLGSISTFIGGFRGKEIVDSEEKKRK